MAGFCGFVIYYGLNIKLVEKNRLTIGRALSELSSSIKYAVIGVVLGIAGAFNAYPLTVADLILGAVIGGAVGAGIGKYRENRIHKSKNFSSGVAKKTKVEKQPLTTITGKSLADEITQLHSLHQAGALSDDEFKAAKSAVTQKAKLL